MIRVEQWFQGPTGSGQGGWTSHRMQCEIGEPVSVAIRRPIPLESNLHIVEVDDAWRLSGLIPSEPDRELSRGPAARERSEQERQYQPGDPWASTNRAVSWHLVDPSQADLPILIATRRSGDFAETTPISIAQAADARTRFPLHQDHPVPVCFSCGQEPDSMQVHSGPLDDGRWATDWRVPDWAVGDDGQVDEGALWAAIDCAQAWYAGNAGGRRHAVTVQLSVEVLAPLTPGETYALVAWNGTYPTDWDGRKRGAGGAVFASDATCVAHSSSFWIAL